MLLLTGGSFAQLLKLTPDDLIYLRDTRESLFNAKIISLGFHLMNETPIEYRFMSLHKDMEGNLKESQIVKRKSDGAVNLFTRDMIFAARWMKSLESYLEISTTYQGNKVCIYKYLERTIEVSWELKDDPANCWYTIALY